jgi:hypothetical protein
MLLEDSQIKDRSRWLLMRFMRLCQNYPWHDPLVNEYEETQTGVFEWWHKDRKVTIDFSLYTVESLKVWGPNIDTEMEEGVVWKDEDFVALWNWLHYKE